jgi:hypothetical protein
MEIWRRGVPSALSKRAQIVDCRLGETIQKAMQTIPKIRVSLGKRVVEPSLGQM